MEESYSGSSQADAEYVQYQARLGRLDASEREGGLDKWRSQGELEEDFDNALLA